MEHTHSHCGCHTEENCHTSQESSGSCWHHHEESSCGCGNHHKEGACSCGCGHQHPEPAGGKALLFGIGLFIAAVVVERLLPGSPWLWLAYLPAYWLLGRGALLTAAKNICKGQVFDENFLMSLATLGAFVIGQAPEAVGVMLFFRIGQWLEEKAVGHSRHRITDAVDMRPEQVLLLDGQTQIRAEQVKPGQQVLVRAGDRIPLDGVVVSGNSCLDTAAITGEPLPLEVTPGVAVLSGSINLRSPLIVEVTAGLSDSLVSKILEAVTSAAGEKPRSQRFITKFAKVYTPLVVAAAALVAVVPSLVTGDWQHWVYTALSFLVMSCPCALVISVPLTFFSGMGLGAKRGILFKNALVLETLWQIKAVALDKTGTVTQGVFRVEAVKVQPGVREEALLSLAAGCEQTSSHPIARSIVLAAEEKGVAPAVVEQLETLPGRGLRGVWEGKQVLCGNPALLEETGIALPPLSEGTSVLVAADGVYLGMLLLTDSFKPQAKAVMENLKNRGLSLQILTGDGQSAAEKAGKALGISEVYGGLLPHEKLRVMEVIRKERGKVLFVGDGLNDSPVLAAADVGAAMGSGTDAARAAGDMVILNSRLSTLAESLEIARKTRRVVWQNVMLSLGFKLAVMALGLFGMASMWLAVFADSGVTMLCIFNALRLLWSKTSQKLQ